VLKGGVLYIIVEFKFLAPYLLVEASRR